MEKKIMNLVSFLFFTSFFFYYYYFSSSLSLLLFVEYFYIIAFFLILLFFRLFIFCTTLFFYSFLSIRNDGVRDLQCVFAFLSHFSLPLLSKKKAFYISLYI